MAISSSPYATSSTSSDQPSYSSSIRPEITLDWATDILRVTLQTDPDVATAEIDDEEVVVFRSLVDGSIVAFDVPHFLAYWYSHLSDLVDHLGTYVPGSEASLQGSFFARSTSIPETPLHVVGG